jgi:D,D-heptose 1,7-bisphosphate phosphatase
MYDLVILAGGRGSRIKQFLNKRPKPLIKILRYNFLDYILFNVSKFFFKNIFIISGYRGHLIKKKYHNKIINLSRIRVLKEKKLKGTGGALYEVKKIIKNDFFIVNGDSIFDIDFFDLIKTINKKYMGAMALTKNYLYQENKKLNNLNLDKKGKIVYLKKSSKSFFMNGGVYFFRKKFLESINKNNLSLELDIIPSLIKKGKMYGKFYNNFFLDIGTKNNLKLAKKKLKFFFKPAIFLDRDGTLNYDKGHTYKVSDLRLIKKVINYLKKKKNYYFFIVTNQSGIAKEKFTENNFITFQRFLLKKLYNHGIYINDIKFCPHHKNSYLKRYKKNCSCRKPNNKMIKDIFKRWPIFKKKSFMIGNSKADRLTSIKSKLVFINVNDI